MTTDQLDSMLSQFGAALDAAGERFALVADGLGYINPNANDGSNEPARPIIPRAALTVEQWGNAWHIRCGHA